MLADYFFFKFLVVSAAHRKNNIVTINLCNKYTSKPVFVIYFILHHKDIIPTFRCRKVICTEPNLTTKEENILKNLTLEIVYRMVYTKED